jgi:uncharacterized protein (UPF0548 family)
MKAKDEQMKLKFDGFGRGEARDIEYLELWRDLPLTYTPGQVVDPTFHRDQHEHVMTANCTAELFAHAADLLLRYQFYPTTMMRHVSDFSREKRLMRVGDRIIQRINGLGLIGIPFSLIDGLTMNIIVAVTDQARRKGFTYATTQAHAELGEWSAAIEWQADDSLVLTINTLSRPAYEVPRLFHPIMRRGQKRAHQLGIAHFKSLVLAGKPSKT